MKISLFSGIKITDVILIAIIPLFGYIAAFFYAVGKFYVLDVPIEYIQINTELILLSSFLTFSLLLIAVIILVIVKLPKTNNYQKYILNGNPVTKSSLIESIIIVLLIPAIVAVTLLFLTALKVFYITAISMGLLILFAGLIFLPPLFRYPNVKGYANKFKKNSEEEYEKK